MNRVLVFAPHPDDEILGCGGTITKHKKSGDIVGVVFITNCIEGKGFSAEIMSKRQKEIQQIKSNLGLDEIFKLDFPTQELDQLPMNRMIGAVSNVINNFKPDIIYLNHYDDVHSDHRISYDVVYSCTKNFRYPFINKVMVYEVPSETEFGSNQTFKPNIFVDISDYIEKKLEFMSIYESEVMPAPYPRSLDSIRALSRWRGSRIGVQYAEAFMLIFERYLL